MKLVEVDLVSAAPYSQSRMHDTPKLDRENPGDYEKRTWREKCNVDADGYMVIPAMALKQALDDTAQKFSTQIPGKGKKTYTAHFKGGVICESDVQLGIKKEDVPPITISANSDGVRGSGKRVPRTFPQIPSWNGTARFVIMDETITEDVFKKHLIDAGRFIGIGRFRPQNGGLNGRFRCENFRFSEYT